MSDILISVNKSSSFSRNGDGGEVMLLLLKLRRLKSLSVPSSFTIIWWDVSGETPLLTSTRKVCEVRVYKAIGQRTDPNENSFEESGRVRICETVIATS